MIYLNLFWSFFQIGLFSIGGGYAAMPLIQNQVVRLHAWLTLQEFGDIVTISQMTPGPIAINAATFVGTRIAGFGGALTATLGCILPSCLIVLLFAALYKKYQNLDTVQGILGGLRPAVIGLIASAGLTILSLAIWHGEAASPDPGSIDFLAVLLIALCLFFLRKSKLNPTYIMLAAGVIGGLLYTLLPLA
ncbi:MAG: chromate transporter [Negativicutes bacterium]|nr:chromate transporter [Negativicutes bacterium]